MLYVCDSIAGLIVVDVTQNMPTFVSRPVMPVSANAISIFGNLAGVVGTRVYHSSPNVRTNQNGFYLYDILNPSHPDLIGKIETTAFLFKDVHIVGNYAYLACHNAGLKIADLSNPSNPQIINTFDTPGSAYGVKVVNNYAYVADFTKGLRILDISNPLNIVDVGTVDTPNGNVDLAIEGNYAYLADNTSLKIIDITNKSNPIIVGSYTTTALKIKVLNKIVYLAGGGIGLVIIDANNPSNPVLLSSIFAGGGPKASTSGMAVTTTRAYVAQYDGGIGVIDITNNSSPVLIGSLLSYGEIMNAI
ncbi:MAG: hypothetical protein AABY22_30565 [Nanoarchaeota archaeon]